MLLNKTINKYPNQRSVEVGTLMPTSVSISCSDGIIVASFKNNFDGSSQYSYETRHEKVSQNTIVSGSGDLSDFQNVILDLKAMEDKVNIYSNGKETFSPNEIINYVASKNYEKRGKMDYNLVEFGIAGRFNGKNILGYVDKYGTLIYQDKYVVTHFGNYYLKPVLDEIWNSELTTNQAKKVLKKSFEILGENTKYSSSKINYMSFSEEKGFEEGEISLDIKFDN